MCRCLEQRTQHDPPRAKVADSRHDLGGGAATKSVHSDNIPVAEHPASPGLDELGSVSHVAHLGQRRLGGVQVLSHLGGRGWAWYVWGRGLDGLPMSHRLLLYIARCRRTARHSAQTISQRGQRLQNHDEMDELHVGRQARPQLNACESLPGSSGRAPRIGLRRHFMGASHGNPADRAIRRIEVERCSLSFTLLRGASLSFSGNPDSEFIKCSLPLLRKT
jgi:hypothetical protein